MSHIELPLDIVAGPVWSVGRPMPLYTPLGKSLQADVCIVGGGMAGLSTAYLLARAGKKVVLLDDGGLCDGMTQKTTAHLTCVLDARFFDLEKLHGAKGARLAAESHAAAIDKIESIAIGEGIHCDFLRVNGYLLLGRDHDAEYLDRELEAAHRAGLVGAHRLPNLPGNQNESGPCLCFPDQAQFHPLRYLAGLAQAIVRDGGQIFTHTHADKIAGGTQAQVHAGEHVVTADSVVIATNSPVNDRFAIHTKQSGYISYVIGARVPIGAVPRALYWDTEDPYHYARLQAAPDPERGSGTTAKHEILIVGGEDHKVGQAEDTEDRHDRLETWARQHFPMMEEVDYKWAGQVMETIDGLAFIGQNPLDSDNVFICTGDNGTGMTHGAIAGILLTDLILGREHPWTALYNPSRKTLRALGDFITENANTVAQYRDWFTAGDIESTDEIGNDQGAILREGMSKIAVYRDEDGQIYKLSAVCTHLGGIVRWNAADKTWDCPCHGSRFDKFGETIMGPANTPLAPLAQNNESNPQ